MLVSCTTTRLLELLVVVVLGARKQVVASKGQVQQDSPNEDGATNMPDSKSTDERLFPADSEPPPWVFLPTTDTSVEENNMVQHRNQGFLNDVATVLNVLESPRKGPVHCRSRFDFWLGTARG